MADDANVQDKGGAPVVPPKLEIKRVSIPSVKPAAAPQAATATPTPAAAAPVISIPGVKPMARPVMKPAGAPVQAGPAIKISLGADVAAALEPAGMAVKRPTLGGMKPPTAGGAARPTLSIPGGVKTVSVKPAGAAAAAPAVALAGQLGPDSMKRETSRIQLDAALGFVDPAKAPAAAATTAEEVEEPIKDMSTEKRMTSRISLDAVLAQSQGGPVAMDAGSKTIKLKKPGELPAIKIGGKPKLPTVVTPTPAGETPSGDANLNRTARLDIEVPDEPQESKRKTIKVKRPGTLQGSAPQTGSAMRISQASAVSVEIQDASGETGGMQWYFVAAAAVAVLCLGFGIFEMVR